MPKKKAGPPWDMLLLVWGLPVVAFLVWLMASLAFSILAFFDHH
jgi:hypothetical protein